MNSETTIYRDVWIHYFLLIFVIFGLFLVGITVGYKMGYHDGLGLEEIRIESATVNLLILFLVNVMLENLIFLLTVDKIFPP